MAVAQSVFWFSLLVVSYVYVGYWLLLLVWSKCAPKPVREGDWEPPVTVVVAVRNERKHIETKLLNLLALDYPVDKLQIIVSMDGPTDGTDAIVLKYAQRGVRAMRLPVHRGKASALNAALAEATGEIIVFADARQQLDTRAVRELVADLHDESVGAVSGELIIIDSDGKEASDGVGLYWIYEKSLRTLESRIDSIAGATGALYALRREFAQPIPEDTILDDVLLPMRAVLSGRRIVHQPRARVYEMGSPPPASEFGRKTRTLTGNYQLLTYMPELLLPWRNRIFLQFVSHKVARLFVPYFLCALFFSNTLLLHSPLFAAVFAFQVVFYLSALGGYFMSTRPVGPHSTRPLLNGRGSAV